MATADTDLEIANALYDNEYGTAGAYKFSYELSSLPTSSAGLTSGALWSDSGTLKIVS